ncbi:uncharacterized protein isoform X1 [Leptinotarsa decemlineata]|uniref:uncharacterized protein isoform X1 n=1 Tax=Leptinotarsa decemlineata TaxID=7539 RepID=UPI003D306B26
MATDEYGSLIKEENESALEEQIYKEKCDAPVIVISKREFESENIKSENVAGVVYYDLKSEKCLEEGKGGLHCEVCGGLSFTTDFFSPDSLESICNCLHQNESNAMQGEDMTWDFKPFNIGADSLNFHFKIKEETLVVKEEEVDNENVPSTLCEDKISVEGFHVVNHETPIKTEEVDETFRSGYDLNSVGQRIQEENEMCSKNLNERTDIGNRPIKKIFNCKVCKKSFSHSCYLKRHEIVHTVEKPFQCKICFKFFTRKDSLTSHDKIHTGEKPFQCKICSKSFIQRSNWKSHEKIHSGEKPFQCKICSKSYIRKILLKLHEKVHTAEKAFQCKVCSKCFPHNESLKLHEKIHTSEKQFQCKICSKSFLRKFYLKTHEKIHSGEKSFQCKICSKSFSQRSNLKVHETIHTCQKPFQCKSCLKSFASKASLKLHEKIHTGEKPYQCKICSKSFIQKMHLNLHENNHTGEKSFQC